MDFPVADLMDERACYDRLVSVLHPRGLACPGCGAADRLGVHRRHRDPVLDGLPVRRVRAGGRAGSTRRVARSELGRE